jgi:hypothetical protein
MMNLQEAAMKRLRSCLAGRFAAGGFRGNPGLCEIYRSN